MTELLATITGIFKFWDQVVVFIQWLRGTPEEQVQKAMAQVHESFKKANDSKGDTSEVEKTISG